MKIPYHEDGAGKLESSSFSSSYSQPSCKEAIFFPALCCKGHLAHRRTQREGERRRIIEEH